MRIERLSPAFFAPPAVDRKFAVILLGSLAAHAACLWLASAPVLQASPPELPRLVASLRQALASPASSDVRALPAESAAAHAPKVRQAPVRPAVLPSPPVATRPVEPANLSATVPASIAANTSAKAAPAAPASTPASLPDVAALSAEPLLAAQATPLGSPAARAAAASPVLPADWQAAYRNQLAALFARRQEYPRIAAARGWEGEVRLRLRVARRGSLLHVQLERSSGFDVLDRHALAMVEALPGLPALPDGAGGDEIQIVVPVHYSLRKTT